MEDENIPETYAPPAAALEGSSGPDATTLPPAPVDASGSAAEGSAEGSQAAGAGGSPGPAPVGARVDGAIERWMAERLRDSPLSGATEAWNHLVSEIGTLRDYIVKEL